MALLITFKVCKWLSVSGVAQLRNLDGIKFTSYYFGLKPKLNRTAARLDATAQITA